MFSPCGSTSGYLFRSRNNGFAPPGRKHKFLYEYQQMKTVHLVGFFRKNIATACFFNENKK